MSEKIESEMISRRRAFRLLGLTAAWGFAATAPSLLASSGAKAQTQGMERRQKRRAGRQDTGGTGGGKSGDTDDQKRAISASKHYRSEGLGRATEFRTLVWRARQACRGTSRPRQQRYHQVEHGAEFEVYVNIRDRSRIEVLRDRAPTAQRNAVQT